MGSPMTLYFLNQQTQAWKDKYIKSWISLGGCWAGTVKALKVYAQGSYISTMIAPLLFLVFFISDLIWTYFDRLFCFYHAQAITSECEF